MGFRDVIGVRSDSVFYTIEYGDGEGECILIKGDAGVDEILRSLTPYLQTVIELVAETLDKCESAHRYCQMHILALKKMLFCVTEHYQIANILPEARLNVSRNIGEPCEIEWNGKRYPHWHAVLTALLQSTLQLFTVMDEDEARRLRKSFDPTDLCTHLMVESASARQVWQQFIATLPTESEPQYSMWKSSDGWCEVFGISQGKLNSLVRDKKLRERQGSHPKERAFDIRDVRSFLPNYVDK